MRMTGRVPSIVQVLLGWGEVFVEPRQSRFADTENRDGKDDAMVLSGIELVIGLGYPGQNEIAPELLPYPGDEKVPPIELCFG